MGVFRRHVVYLVWFHQLWTAAHAFRSTTPCLPKRRISNHKYFPKSPAFQFQQTSTTSSLLLSSPTNSKDSELPHPRELTSSVSLLPSVQACQDSDVILVDVENLRGKSGFAWTHRQIINALAAWSSDHDKTILCIDHGSAPTCLYLESNIRMGIVFAGPSVKADDVLANDLVPYFAAVSIVTLVTADAELIHRCKRAARVTQQLQVLSPQRVLDDLDSIVTMSSAGSLSLVLNDVLDEEYSSVSDDSSTTEKISSSGNAAENNIEEQQQQETLELLDHEIKLGAQLLEAEALLHGKRRGLARMNHKRKKKLQLKAQTLREKLFQHQARGSIVDQLVTDLIQHGTPSSSMQRLPKHQQDALLERFEKIRKSSNRRKEQTGDRVVLAEQLRRQLLQLFGETITEAISIPQKKDSTENSGEDSNPAVRLAPGKAFALMRQALDPMTDFPAFSNNGETDGYAEEIKPKLRLVVVSDTHGMEEQLGETLPDGDVLVHLGDFSIDRGPVQDYLIKFDQWLANQPHRHKIVLRGNHDPRSFFLPHSGATVVTRPQSMKLNGFSFYLIPFTRSLTVRSMPRARDVILSHVPPRGFLDQHYLYREKHVGDITLRRGVERMNGGPPVLWLCGHIHEGRGSLRHAFVQNHKQQEQSQETLVVNAANANAGLASRLEHGPVIVDLLCDPKTGLHKRAEIVTMDGQYEYINRPMKHSFFDQQESKEERLLAIDLGLRTGVCLFNNKGRLLRLDYFQFETPIELEAAAMQILNEWGCITKIAIEGGDPPLRDCWYRSAQRQGGAAILNVKPEEWRADLLISKEKTDGEKAKAASRLIARQILADYSDLVVEGKFQTDLAESVLLGLHVARRLGWITARDPPIRRFTNGNVIISTREEESSAVVAG